MTLPDVARSMLDAMPWVTVTRAPMRERGRYYPEHRVAMIRHGLRGPAYVVALVHELVHAERGDEPCAHPDSECQQELAVRKEVARRLIDIRALARVAAIYPDDAHKVADEWSEWQYAQGMSEATVTARTRRIEMFAEVIGNPLTATHEDVVHYMASLPRNLLQPPQSLVPLADPH